MKGAPLNWINVKDRLPEDNQVCLIYIKENSVMTIAYYDASEPQSFNLPDNISDGSFIYWKVKEYDIYWMPIDDIPKPEMK